VRIVDLHVGDLQNSPAYLVSSLRGITYPFYFGPYVPGVLIRESILLFIEDQTIAVVGFAPPPFPSTGDTIRTRKRDNLLTGERGGGAKSYDGRKRPVPLLIIQYRYPLPCTLSDLFVPCTYLGLAKLFFAELAKKGNTLYNVMPDIVSRLSDPEVGIAEDQFR
jgi:hypothetical protein